MRSPAEIACTGIRVDPGKILGSDALRQPLVQVLSKHPPLLRATVDVPSIRNQLQRHTLLRSETWRLSIQATMLKRLQWLSWLHWSVR